MKVKAEKIIKELLYSVVHKKDTNIKTTGSNLLIKDFREIHRTDVSNIDVYTTEENITIITLY